MKGRRRPKTALPVPGAAEAAGGLYRPCDYEREVPVTTSEPEPYRTEFRRDFQRTLHSPSFRRLQGKTQLFPSEEHNFYRTRLTHSLEVAQIAKSIAIRLNNNDSYFLRNPINLDLVEFAGLAHDLGHPPFGHNGEYILDELMRNFGGFEGNAQTFRILTKLEKKITTEFPPQSAVVNSVDGRKGLNLTFRTLASVLKYDKEIPITVQERERQDNHKKPCKGYYACDSVLVKTIKRTIKAVSVDRFKTIECSIMDLADDIAYSTYDIEDAFAAGFLNPIAILSVSDEIKRNIVTAIQEKINKEYSDLANDERHFTIDDLNRALGSVFAAPLHISEEVFRRRWTASELGAYVGGEVYRTSVLLAKSPYHRTQFTSDLIGRLVRDVSVNKCCDNPIFWQVRPSIGEFGAIESLKSICMTQLINSDKFLAEKNRARHIISRIFFALRESGSDLLPEDWRLVYRLYQDDEVQRNRAICDFVSGMTNSYCIEFYERLYGVRPPSIHKPQATL